MAQVLTSFKAAYPSMNPNYAKMEEHLHTLLKAGRVSVAH